MLAWERFVPGQQLAAAEPTIQNQSAEYLAARSKCGRGAIGSSGLKRIAAVKLRASVAIAFVFLAEVESIRDEGCRSSPCS
jgi:hypothetical protein